MTNTLTISFPDWKSTCDLWTMELHVHDPTGNSLARYRTVYLELLERQRTPLDEMNQSADFDEELIRKYLSLIDMEEFRLREKQLGRENNAANI